MMTQTIDLTGYFLLVPQIDLMVWYDYLTYQMSLEVMDQLLCVDVMIQYDLHLEEVVFVAFLSSLVLDEDESLSTCSYLEISSSKWNKDEIKLVKLKPFSK